MSLTPTSPTAIYVDIAFGNGPQETSPTWNTIGNVISVDVQRGRASSVEPVQAGRASILVDNRLRTYDPLNTASAEYGNGFCIEPGKRIQIRVDCNGVVERKLFTGHVIGWYLDYSQDERFPMVRIEAVDAFGYFGTRRLNISLPAQTAGARITAILDAIGWPSDALVWRLVAADSTAIAATTYTGTNAFEAIQAIAQAARGVAYIEPNGRFLYQSEAAGRLISLTATAGRFGNMFDGAPYKRASFAYDRTEIYNEANITPSSGNTQTYVGQTTGNYFTNVFSLSCPLANDSDALALAQSIVNRYQYPRRRLQSLTIDLQALKANRLLLDTNRRIEVALQQHTGPTVIQRFFIEGVHHRIPSLLGWETTYILSPAEYYNAWALGALYGQSILGQNTNLS